MKEGSTQPYWFLEKACPEASELCLGLDQARACGWVWVCVGSRLPGLASSPGSKPVTCGGPPRPLPAQAACRKPSSSHDQSPHLHSLSSVSSPDTLPPWVTWSQPAEASSPWPSPPHPLGFCRHPPTHPPALLASEHLRTGTVTLCFHVSFPTRHRGCQGHELAMSISSIRVCALWLLH